MAEENNYKISKVHYDRLIKISQIFNIGVEELMDYAINHLFDLIKNEPIVFLEEFGIVDHLKSVASDGE